MPRCRAQWLDQNCLALTACRRRPILYDLIVLFRSLERAITRCRRLLHGSCQTRGCDISFRSCCSRLSPLNQLSQEDHLHPNRLVTDELELVYHLFDIDTFDKDRGRRRQFPAQPLSAYFSCRTHISRNKTSSLLTGLGYLGLI